MMRKFNKKKAAKRGAILVTVVFVLAFATIFIAAAMMLTQATRKRVYTEAENNQARLTVTSVAESWLHALQKCEISDSAILALCKAGAGGTGTPVRVKASATSNTIPGLETENTSSTTSFTEVTFTRSPNKTGASKDEEYTYIADFSTHIDGQVENVRAYLTYTPPTSTGGGKPFSTQIDLNAEFGQNNLEIVGDGKAQGDLDNIFLIRRIVFFISVIFHIHCGDQFSLQRSYSIDVVLRLHLSGAVKREKVIRSRRQSALPRVFPILSKSAVNVPAAFCGFHINKFDALLFKSGHINIRLILGQIHADGIPVAHDPCVDPELLCLYGKKQQDQQSCRSARSNGCLY